MPNWNWSKRASRSKMRIVGGNIGRLIVDPKVKESNKVVK